MLTIVNRRLLLLVLSLSAFCQAGAQSPATPSPSPAPAGLVLYHNWDTPLHGGSETLKDLMTLLGPIVKAQPNLAADPSIEVYPGVPYLLPFKDAVKALGLTSSLPSRNSVSTPGFPADSFYYYTFNGLFEEGFNLMLIVVDKADQVVCIQFVSESPTGAQFENADWGNDKGWRTYNFVNYKNKAVKRLKIDHEVDLFVQGKTTPAHWRSWTFLQRSGHSLPPFNEIRIDSFLIDMEARGDHPNATMCKPLEAVRWYLPLPLAQTILYCVGKAGNSSTFGSN